MIVANIHDSRLIEPLHPGFKELFNYIKSTDLLALEEEKIVLSDKVFIMNTISDQVSKNEQLLETHKKYIDVHFPLDRTECIGWKAASTLTQITTSSDLDDYTLYKDTTDMYFQVSPGEFVVFYPEDAHAPLIGEGKIHKLVAKVSVE